MKLDSSLLHIVCAPAEFRYPERNLHLAQKLTQLMIAEKGVGLAANQVGHNIRLFVMFVDREIFHCFNPEIIDYGDQIELSKEGCLSYPGEVCQVPRYKKILARFYNTRGNPQERVFTGLAARCFQHELDHLNGITMHERMTNDQQTV